MRGATFQGDESRSPAPLRCVVAYNTYGAYCVPESSRHRPAAMAILAGQIYEPNTIGFMRQFCGDGDIVHAGTYFGDFLPALASACKGTIWAFEPNLENFRCAEVTVLLNGLANISMVRAGLGEMRGTMPLTVTDQNGVPRGGSSTFVSEALVSAELTELVPIVRIDDAVPADRHVSVLQLDVEGYEQQALIGALGTIERCRPAIAVEILQNSPLRTTDWVARNIFARGYRLAGTVHGNAIYLPA
jgi:FkbM family methyltransferase